MVRKKGLSRGRGVQCSDLEYKAHVRDYDGLCLACWQWTSGGVEPDACGYECPECGEHTVIGAEDAMLMGLVDIQD